MIWPSKFLIQIRYPFLLSPRYKDSSSASTFVQKQPYQSHYCNCQLQSNPDLATVKIATNLDLATKSRMTNFLLIKNRQKSNILRKFWNSKPLFSNKFLLKFSIFFSFLTLSNKLNLNKFNVSNLCFLLFFKRIMMNKWSAIENPWIATKSYWKSSWEKKHMNVQIVINVAI